MSAGWRVGEHRPWSSPRTIYFDDAPVAVAESVGMAEGIVKQLVRHDKMLDLVEQIRQTARDSEAIDSSWVLDAIERAGLGS